MTKEEKLNCLNKILVEYENNISISELSKKYNISCPTISKYLKENNVEIRKQNANRSSLKNAILELNVSSAEEVSKKFGIDQRILEASKDMAKSELKKLSIELAIKTYIETDGYHRSIDTISTRFGINKKTLAKYLRERNIQITKKSDFANCNETIFDSIDTEEKAYWLGFLYADGYITENNYNVGLGLSLKDQEHILKFNEFLQFDHGATISKTHQFGTKETQNKAGNELYMCSTQIHNQHLWNSLKDKGCVPHKSLILTFPKESLFKSRDLIYHFIRGYFDGDGSLGLYPHSKTNSNLEESLNFVGTENFLKGIQQYLGNGFLMQKPNCNERTYRLSYSTKKAREAAELMYQNATIYLNRKYNIYTNDFASRNREKTVKAETPIPC